MTQHSYRLEHPLLGTMVLEGSYTTGLQRLRFVAGSPTPPADCEEVPDPLLLETAQRLQAYFLGETVDFDDLLVAPQGTVFQQGVWQVLRQIPAGTTCSYQWVAQRIGQPRAVRAVGQANKFNPLPIIIPCHRVVRANGQLGGYVAGPFMKQYLLNLEQHQSVLMWPSQLTPRQSQAMTLL